MNTSPATAPIDVPVLIVGGGPVGLTTSLFLSRAGIRSLLVEKHSDTATLPKARSINARTMEMYRQLGLEADIRAEGMEQRFRGMILWAESLSGAEIKRLAYLSSAESLRISPTPTCGCAQDLLEPILRRHAEAAAPGCLRFGVRMQDLRYGAEGASGLLVDSGSGEATPFRSRYVVAADGSQSSIRRQLGVSMVGERDVYDSVNMHFRADLTRWVDNRPAALYFIEQPELRGTFLTINGSTRWSFLVQSISHYGYKPEDFTHEFCKQLIRKAIGESDVDIEILGVGAWTASAIVADRYRDGPVFLVGDAAHEMPPTGGLGLNTGVQDAQNLAWKLAAVIRGEAGDTLLDSYDAERRVLGEFTTRVSLLNALSMGRTARQSSAVLARDGYLKERGVVFGFRYNSSALVAEADTQAPVVEDPVTQYVASATPGCRAPHAWLQQGGQKVSTIDLFGRGFVLLAGPRGQGWKAAAAAQVRPAVRGYVIGADVVDADGSWQELYGVGPCGAVLVRPDGIVAWRTPDAVADPAAALSAVLALTLGQGVVEATGQMADAAT
jgi:putative polyketide hydroxylase